MAIALYSYEEETLKREIIPISSQSYFNDTWMMLCKKLDLEWIPLFESGFEFHQEDIPFIIGELNRLYIQCRIDLNRTEPILERIEWLLQALENLIASKIKKFYIG
jgi:hypothetical protein